MLEKIAWFFIYFGIGVVGFTAVQAMFAICKLPQKLKDIEDEIRWLRNAIEKKDGEE